MVQKDAREKRTGEKKLLKTGDIHNISPDYTPPELCKALRVEWRQVLCRAGEVRVTESTIPHRALGPAKGDRRTMLP